MGVRKGREKQKSRRSYCRGADGCWGIPNYTWYLTEREGGAWFAPACCWCGQADQAGPTAPLPFAIKPTRFSTLPGLFSTVLKLQPRPGHRVLPQGQRSQGGHGLDRSGIQCQSFAPKSRQSFIASSSPRCRLWWPRSRDTERFTCRSLTLNLVVVRQPVVPVEGD